MGPKRRRLLYELQLGLFLVGEACWLAVVALALGRWPFPQAPAPLIGLGPILATLVLATAATRLAMRHLGGARPTRWAMALLGLLVVAAGAGLGLSGPAAAAPAGAVPLRGLLAGSLALVVWWRGLGAGREQLSPTETSAGFRDGIVALSIVFVLNTIVPGRIGLPPLELVSLALGFVFAGLVGVP